MIDAPLGWGSSFKPSTCCRISRRWKTCRLPCSWPKSPLSSSAAAPRSLSSDWGLGDRLDHKPCELSAGQQQRVALARTLANNPQAILADEPSGNLDPNSRAHVLALFDDFVREGRTIVMVTHDPGAAARASRRIAIHDGQITNEDTGLRQVA